MAIEIRVQTVHMISTHDIPDGLKFYNPGVLPSRFFIPSVDAKARDVTEKCNVDIRDPGKQRVDRVGYARRTEDKAGNPYILLEIPAGKAIRYGTEEQKHDEFGAPLNPAIERALLHVDPGEMANEIERQYAKYGVITIHGDEPTEVELKKSREAYKAFVTEHIRYVSSAFKRYGAREVTPLNLYFAASALKKGWITVLPEWATYDVNAQGGTDLFPCKVCGATLRKGTIRCSQANCGAIYNWPEAVRLGIKSPVDIPEEFREECVKAGVIREVAGSAKSK